MTDLDRKTAAEALIPQFQLEKVLQQDQSGRRISLLGQINSQPALINLERAAFPADTTAVTEFLNSITNLSNLQHNDIYRWYMASRSIPSTTSSPSTPDLKLNLIYPVTPSLIRKYSPQPLRSVTETPEIYARYIRPYMRRCREEGRLNWVFNILEGRTEQEDVILRHPSQPPPAASLDSASLTADASTVADEDNEGFLLLPDLNWDRETIRGGLHLLALIYRRDIWSLRDLRKSHVAWLKHLRDEVVSAVVKVYAEHGVGRDELKCYVHYQPTYYHFHIHVVHVELEPTATQAVGKAFSLDTIISILEVMGSFDSATAAVVPNGQQKDIIQAASGSASTSAAAADSGGMDRLTLSYTLGEASELWTKVFAKLKEGEEPDIES